MPDPSSDKIGVIILAAGNSSRLGKPKQQLIYKQTTLLQHAVQVATDAGFEPIIVVLGASYSEIIPSLDPTAVDIVENIKWQEGMATSIQTGLSRLTTLNADTAGVILMVCDQPYVTPHLLRKLKMQWQATGRGIVACAYADTIGTPALIPKDYFEDLLKLEGQEGAKKILLAYKSFVSQVPFPLGQVDIDTQEDYNNLEQK